MLLLTPTSVADNVRDNVRVTLSVPATNGKTNGKTNGRKTYELSCTPPGSWSRTLYVELSRKVYAIVMKLVRSCFSEFNTATGWRMNTLITFIENDIERS